MVERSWACFPIDCHIREDQKTAARLLPSIWSAGYSAYTTGSWSMRNSPAHFAKFAQSLHYVL